MAIDQITNLLVTVTLIEMMITIGLGVTISELLSVARNWRLMAKAALANYVCVPAATIGLLLLFRTQPMAAAGFLILAVCPGAPYGPPFTSIAKGNVTVAVGLMVLLAGSSAIIAPLLLGLLLPLMAGDKPLHVDTVKIVMTLLVTQLLPLCVGLSVRHWRPVLAERLIKPANLISKILNLIACGLIIGTQYHMLSEIRLVGFFGMLLLLLASFSAGWVFGGPGAKNRKTLTLTTSLRNVGVGLVIATGNFAGTPAVTAALAYGIFEILASLLLALRWGRLSRQSDQRESSVE
jgi:BASS family bile acid:Na+ symporter